MKGRERFSARSVNYYQSTHVTAYMSLILYTPKWWFQMPQNCIVLCVVGLRIDKSQLIRILMLLTWSLTYLLRVLLDKLNGSQPVKISPALYGNRSFITAFTNSRHLSLSWTSSCPTYNFLKIRLNIILPSTPRSSRWSNSLRFHHQIPVCTSPPPTRATCPTHLILLDLIISTILGEEYRSLSSSYATCGNCNAVWTVHTFTLNVLMRRLHS